MEEFLPVLERRAYHDDYRRRCAVVDVKVEASGRNGLIKTKGIVVSRRRELFNDYLVAGCIVGNELPPSFPRGGCSWISAGRVS